MPSPLQTTIRDLQRPRGRERRGLTLAEGVRLVEEAMHAENAIAGVVYAPALENSDRGRGLIASLQGSGVPLERVEDQELVTLAETQHPQGIIAVIRVPRWTLDQIKVTAGPVLVLDGVQDPGNVGTILRTARGLGASGVITLPGSVELANPKVVRGSMGAVFRVPALALPLADFREWAEKLGMTVLLADTGGVPIAQVPLTWPLAIVVGNEGAGLSPGLLSLGQPVAITLAPGAESLNVAIATAILLYEVTRER